MDPIHATILKKTAWRLVPILTIAYVLNYLDRTNISFAALTMKGDLGLTATQFGFGAGILFLGYTVFEIPSNLALYRVGARRWIARIMITWGVISAGMAFVNSAHSFYILRFLLGVAEAGFFPGVTFYLAAWFPAQYRTQILAWYLVAIPLSSLIGAPISALLLELHGVAGLAGWKWLFIAEGIPSVIVGIMILRILADRPSEASWLTRDEQQALTTLLAAEKRERPQTNLLEAITDIRVIILALVQFGFTLGSYGIGIWLPQIIKGYSLSNLTVNLLAGVPYLFASAAMIAWAWHVDKSGKKIGNLTIACSISVIGLVISVLTHSLIIGMAGMTIALIGVTSARAIFWTIPTRFLAGLGAAGGLAFINSIGTAGGFAGPYMMGWLKDLTGDFVTGLLAMAGIMVAATILAASLKLVIKEE